MLSKLDIFEPEGSILETLPLPRGGNSNKYELLHVSGVDSVPAELVFGSSTARKGGYHSSTNIGTRNIILTIGYRNVPSEGLTVQELRRELFSLFLPGRRLYLRFSDGTGIFKWVIGYVESNEASLFTKDPTSQVSIICEEPYFNGSTVNEGGVAGPSSAFEYDGNAPTTFTLTVNFTGSNTVTNIYINGTQHMRIGHSFQAGDQLRLSTRPGNKYIRRVRGGTTSNILEWVQDGTFDMELTPGGAFGVQIGSGRAEEYSLVYINKYSGL